MRAVRLCLLCLLLLTSVSLAGVVEDAEELLQDLPSDAPIRATLYPNGESSRSASQTSSVTSPASSLTGGSTSSSSTTFRDQAGRSAQATGPGGSKAGLDTGLPPIEDEAARRRSLQESKDRALTFGGVLLVLFFIALAGYYGRRLAGSSD